jgi:hypothetical protein
MQKLWQQQSNAALPWMVIRFPESESDSLPFWAAPLNADTAKSLIDSPARQEIATRLLKGDSAVWVLIESGQPTEDDAVATLLATELKKMETAIELPPPAADDPPMRSALPVRVVFSVLRISRTNSAEEMLIRILLNGAKDTVEPIACPIFGRGRMLAALTKKELRPKLIAEACSFVCGACSCEVKELSPGRDLLLAANWASIFASPAAPNIQKPKLPPPTIAEGSVAAKAPAVLDAAPPPVNRQPTASRVVLAWGVVLAALLVVITGLRAFHPNARR